MNNKYKNRHSKYIDDIESIKFINILNVILSLKKKLNGDIFEYCDNKKEIYVRKIYNGAIVGIINNMYFRTIKNSKNIIIETYSAKRLPVELKVNHPIEERRIYYKSTGIIENDVIKKIDLNFTSFVDIWHSIYDSKDDYPGIKFYTEEYRELKENLIYYLEDKYYLKNVPFSNQKPITITKENKK